MFEEGAQLKEKFGAENVYDFSLGNPKMPPPEKFHEILRNVADSSGSGDHRYMPNVGHPTACRSVADYLAAEQHAPVTNKEVVMTCGASGALNVVLKTILDPGDEVVAPAPCFVEYKFYADNHGGVFRTAPTKPDFHLDLDALSEAISERTKAVLINSPNNPTGQVYTEESLLELGALLEKKSKDLDRTLYLISDEPYRKIAYDDVIVPSLFSSYKNSIVVTSYSKDLSIPGERIGFAAVNPAATYKDDLMAGMTVANRILGYVNAPALMQRVVEHLQGVSVEIAEYTRKRDSLCGGLASFGYKFVKPAGAFYLFPRSPIPDDVEFVNALKEERVLVVPGSGFGGPGHFRIAFCVDDDTIKNSMGGFKKTFEKYR